MYREVRDWIFCRVVRIDCPRRESSERPSDWREEDAAVFVTVGEIVNTLGVGVEGGGGVLHTPSSDCSPLSRPPSPSPGGHVRVVIVTDWHFVRLFRIALFECVVVTEFIPQWW